MDGDVDDEIGRHVFTAQPLFDAGDEEDDVDTHDEFLDLPEV